MGAAHSLTEIPLQPPPDKGRAPVAAAGHPSARFWRRGEPFVWLAGAGLATVLAMMAALFSVILWNAVPVFWPTDVALVVRSGGERVFGQPLRSHVERRADADEGARDVRSLQFKTANRDLDSNRQDFYWYPAASIEAITYPADIYVVERVEHGDFYGTLAKLNVPDLPVRAGEDLDSRFHAELAAVRRESTAELEPLAAESAVLNDQLRTVHSEIEEIGYRRARQLDKNPAANVSGLDAQLAQLADRAAQVARESDAVVAIQGEREAALRRNAAIFHDAAGQSREIVLADIVRAYQPNAMGLAAKSKHYAAKVWELLTGEPRESNTEGGFAPAIFGTVMLVMLMAVFCFPLGVLAGIYLGEYAKDGPFVRMVRIAVNNLAGIPSIVYGIFGLGFFVYGLGGLIDQWFFPARLAMRHEPTFGTGGILWASLTLGLLTVPVVIVATEEALRTIPRSMREGSYALGATQFQTLVRVLLPIASPGLMTGFMLAMARAAGEVAPLMITGVVKLAPDLPIDARAPFFHLDRKFMHLGFHIYDIGFQSPNVEASKPMVYVTTLLLLAIVLTLSSTAIYLRNRMRSRLQTRTM